ncbi:MAG: ribosome recycling factor [Armatimonadetes bacterium]|nr:ribosome recycling factor [Armatimonadota bacterium]
MVQKVLEEAEQKMRRTVEAVERELAGVRTGRATPGLLEPIKVDYYGSQLPVNQLATVSIPEPRLMVIAPWDPGALQAIEKAIMSSELGIMPQSDGKVIRLSIPPLTEERRQELAKLVSRMAEDGRVAVRNVRRDANERLDKLENEGVSEDDIKAAKKKVQDLADKYIQKIDELLDRKVQEIMEE